MGQPRVWPHPPKKQAPRKENVQKGKSLASPVFHLVQTPPPKTPDPDSPLPRIPAAPNGTSKTRPEHFAVAAPCFPPRTRCRRSRVVYADPSFVHRFQRTLKALA